MLTTPLEANFPTLYAGSHWAHSLQLEGWDLTGYRAVLEVRRAAGYSRILRLTTEDGRIGIDGPTGTVSLFLDADDSAGITMQEARGSLVLIPPAGEHLAFRAWEGRIPIKAAITIL